MGQIHLATGLALNAVLGLCCLQNVCCPFPFLFFFFSCQSHRLHFCPTNLFQSVEKLRSLAFYVHLKEFSRTGILVTPLLEILNQAVHLPDKHLQRFLGSVPVAG